MFENERLSNIKPVKGSEVTFYSYNQAAVIRVTTNWTSTIASGQAGMINAPLQNNFCVYPDK